jgi:hypothetical protein
MYAHDYDDVLPFCGYTSSIFWWTKIADYAGGNTKTFDGVWTCPGACKDVWLGYGWNYYGIGASPSDPRDGVHGPFGPTRVGRGKDGCILLADSIFACPILLYPSFQYIGGDRSNNHMSTLATPNGLPVHSQTHNKGLNVLTVGGRVDWHPWGYMQEKSSAIYTNRWGFFYE